MKKVLTSIVASFVLLFGLFTSQASAKVIANKEGEVNIPKEEVVNDDLFIGAQSVAVEGTVNGDVFIGAQNAEIGGIVNGNLHIGAQTIKLNGTVKGNVYAGSQNLTVSGAEIGGSIITGGQNIIVDSTSVIGGSVIAGASSVNVNSQIERNFITGTGILVIGDKAQIGKDLYYASGADVEQTSISDKATVGGEIHKRDINQGQEKTEQFRENANSVFMGAKKVGTFLSFLGALVVGIITLKLFKPFIVNATATVKKSFWKSLGIGFLITVGFIPGIIVLLLTVVGIPLIGIAILLLILYSYIAKIIVANVFGEFLKEKLKLKTSEIWTFVLGMLVFYIIKTIPVVGGLVGTAVVWAGLGSIVTNIFKKAKENK